MTNTVYRNTNNSGLKFWAIVTIVLAALPGNDLTTPYSAYTWDYPWSKPLSKNCELARF